MPVTAAEGGGEAGFCFSSADSPLDGAAESAEDEEGSGAGVCAGERAEDDGDADLGAGEGAEDDEDSGAGDSAEDEGGGGGEDDDGAAESLGSLSEGFESPSGLGSAFCGDAASDDVGGDESIQFTHKNAI